MNKKYNIKRRFIRESVDFGRLEYTQFLPKNVLDRLRMISDEAQKLADLINSHEYILDTENVKLYDVFYNFDDVDDWFLQDEFEYFENYVKDKDCELDYIGRTSSFYVTNSFMSYIHDNCVSTRGGRRYSNTVISPEDIIWAIAETQYNNSYLLSDVTQLLSDDKMNEYLHDEIMGNYDVDFNDVGAAVEEFVNDDISYDFEIIFDLDKSDFDSAKKDIENVIAVYDYIRSFKKNQVQIYQDFLDANSDF